LAASTTLRIEYFPSGTPPPTSSDVGICFSGGGSRALAATLGQLRALKALNVLDKVSMISSVSGGAWAAALFTYLPTSITDDDFLGPAVAPGAITLQSLGVPPPNTYLGSVPQNLSIDKLLSALMACIDDADYAPWDLWQGIVGECILKPFGLWDVDANRYPTKYYACTPEDAQAIVARNPGLSVSDFYVVQRPRPRLLMNGAMFSNPTIEDSQLLPFQSASTGIGIAPLFKGQGVFGWDIGGGLIETVGMGSSFIKPLSASDAEVTMPARPFSLSDMIAISSAAFAHVLQAKFSDRLYPLAETIVPTYRYWPVGSLNTEPWNYLFADGGCLENTGIATLLSHGIRNIIAFVNSQTPIQDGVEGQISGLFGPPSGPSEPYAVLSAEPTFCQVFDHSDLAPLVAGLRNANRQGPAMFLQTLQTVPNSNFGVPRCQVRVLWVCNAWVDAWYEALQSNVQQVVQQQRTLMQFPYYDTILQLDLNPTQVNLLAHLACWGLQTNAPLVLSLFDGMSAPV
jgi:hypothetical protein